MKERKKIGIDPWSIKKYWKDLQPPDINKIKASKSKFYDETFPPNKNSLISKKKNGEFVDKVRGPIQLQDFEDDNPGGSERLIWKRVTDISPKWEIFEEKIEFKDVLQGSLGDCYFLSSITALSEYPFLIREKFRTRKFNEEGYYEIVFFIDGEWQIIFLDDYFPYDPEIKNFAFAQPNNNELWAILLEKGWAKINGGYSNIIGGIVSEPICALTGFPTEFLSHKELEEIEIFDKIEKGDKEGTIMSSASKGNDEIEERQLVRSHAYTLISAKKWKERNLFLLKLRNPWGEGEWNGNWSDDSQCWTDEYKEYFDYKLNNDGIFWIDISDYVNNFDSTYICYILYGSIVRNFYFEYQSYFKKPVIFNMKVKEKSKMSVSILFKSWRFNREIADLSHPFSLILCKYDNNRRIEKLWGNWSCKDDISIIDVFEPGYYIIWLYLATKGNNDPDFRYTVQVSSLFNFDIEFLGLDHKCTNVENCIYSSGGECKECLDGFYYDKINKTCTKWKNNFLKNCKSNSAFDHKICEACKDNYYLNRKKNLCLPNTEKNKFYKCQVSNDNGEECAFCVKDYFIGRLDKKCSLIQGCLKSLDEGVCLKCDKDFCLDNNGYCVDNYEIKEIDKKYIYRCSELNKNGDECLKCEKKELEINNDGLCYDKIHCEKFEKGICIKCQKENPDGYYSYCLNKEFGCIDSFHKNCLRCDNILNLDECTQCDIGYELDKEGNCVKYQ